MGLKMLQKRRSSFPLPKSEGEFQESEDDADGMVGAEALETDDPGAKLEATTSRLRLQLVITRRLLQLGVRRRPVRVSDWTSKGSIDTPTTGTCL